MKDELDQLMGMMTVEETLYDDQGTPLGVADVIDLETGLVRGDLLAALRGPFREMTLSNEAVRVKRFLSRQEAGEMARELLEGDGS